MAKTTRPVSIAFPTKTLRTVDRIARAEARSRSQVVIRALDRAYADSANTRSTIRMTDSTPNNSTAGHVPDSRLSRHGGVPIPTQPRGGTSREGDISDPTLPRIPKVEREF